MTNFWKSTVINMKGTKWIHYNGISTDDTIFSITIKYYVPMAQVTRSEK